MMNRKLFAVLFCLIFAVFAAPFADTTAFAQQYNDKTVIHEVDVFGFVEPVVGEYPITLKDLSVPEDAPYKIWALSWNTFGTFPSPDKPYDKDMHIAAVFLVQVTDNTAYRFADDLTVRINGRTDLVSSYHIDSVQNSWMEIRTDYYDLRGEKYEEPIYISDFTLPQEGTCPDNYSIPTVPAGVPYYVDNVIWLESAPYRKIENGETFGCDEYYAEITIARTSDEIYFGTNDVTITTADGVTVRGNAHYYGSRITFTTEKYDTGIPVDKVEINGYSEPQPEALPFTADAISLPDDSQFELQSVVWRDNFHSREMNAGERFTYGIPYEMRITLNAKEGYFLKSGDAYKPEVIVNGKTYTDNSTFSYSCDYEANTVTISKLNFEFEREIERIDIQGFIEPAVGNQNKTVLSVPEDCGYSIDSAFWVDLETYSVLPENAAFSANKCYAMGVVITLDRGSWGSTCLPATLNGRADLVIDTQYLQSNGEPVIDRVTQYDKIVVTSQVYDFRTALDSININGIVFPEAGAVNSTKAYTASGSKYRITDVCWIWEKGDQYGEMELGEKFTEDRLYYLMVDVVPDSGYTIDADTVLSINGTTDLVDLTYCFWDTNTLALSSIDFAFNSPASGIRIAGKSRQATAAEISRQLYPDGTKNVVLASGDDYADALAGVPLADALDAPILLVRNSRLDDETIGEIRRLGAENIYILGGILAISENVELELSSIGCKVIRIAGNSRFETSASIAKKLMEIAGAPTEVFFVVSNNYPDALAASSVAAIKGAPILYIAPNGKLHSAITQYLEKCNVLQKAYILGGYIAIDKAADTNVGRYVKTERIYGSDRYATCIAINSKFSSCFSGDAICAATGLNYPDALAGGVFCAKNKMPLILCGKYLTEKQYEYIASFADPELYVLGGKQAVSNAMVNMILNIVSSDA